jgi:hypothetical protein
MVAILFKQLPQFFSWPEREVASLAEWGEQRKRRFPHGVKIALVAAALGQQNRCWDLASECRKQSEFIGNG